MADVAMPRLSDSMEEGTILKWLKSDGDEVKRGEELVEIETDKANMTYEADQDGVLKIVASEGDTLPVGETIASIGEGSGGDSDGEADSSEPEAKEDSEPAAEDEAQPEAEEDSEAQAEETQPAAEEESEPQAEEESEPQAEGESEPEAEEESAPQAEEDSEPEAKDASEAEAEEDSAPEAEQAAEPEAEEDSEPTAAEDSEPEAEADEPEPDAQGSGGGENGRIKASPVARRMAREMGLELARLEGTGPGGRIVKADVEAAAEGSGGEEAEPVAEEQSEATAEEPKADEAKAKEPKAEEPNAAEEPQEEEPEETPQAEEPEPEEEAKSEEAKAEEPKEEPKREVPSPVAAGEVESGRGEATIQELTRLQKTVARRMAESKATAPEFVLNIDVDMEQAVELRKQLKVASGDKPAPSFNDFVIKACALALTEFPRANGAYRDGKFELYSRVNVGVAVAGQDALVVPTVFDADRKSLGQIARESRALAERVRAGKITPPELSSGTFTVSNLGMFGIDHFIAVINPPQAAILAVGAMKPQAVVQDGEITARTLMKLTLACDHRILYGSDAAEFLARIRELLENPLSLAL